MKNHKRLIAFMLVAVMALSGTIMNAVSAAKLTDAYKYTIKSTSTDVDLAHAIDVLQQLGVVAGVSQVTDRNGEVTEYTFDGDSLVTRQQFALFTARISTATPSLFVVAPNDEIRTKTKFKDLVDKTYTLAIDYCYNEGYILGRDEESTIFDPTGNITYAEAVTMLIRSLARPLGYKYDGFVYPIGFMSKASDSDVKLIGRYADFEMNNIDWNARITRAEMAMLLWNYLLIGNYEVGTSNNTSGDSYVVKFDLNYNNPVGRISDQTIAKGGYASRPTTENVKRANYLLTGWYTDKDCKNEFSFDTKINANITLYAKWIQWNDNVDNPYYDIKQIYDILLDTESKYYNSQGYVNYRDFDKVMKEALICAKQLLEQNKIIGYENPKDSYSLNITQKNGDFYGYTPTNHEIKSGGSSNIQIKTYLPDNLIGSKSTMLKTSAEIVQALSRTNSHFSVHSSNYSNNQVNFETLEEMAGKIILWDSHGYWVNDTIGCALQTGVEVTPDTEMQDYIIDYKNKGWIKTAGGNYYITYKYINENEKLANCFKGALIYLNTCHSLRNNVLAQAFRNQGASVVLGNTNTIGTYYANFISDKIMTRLLDEKWFENELYTVHEAMDWAVIQPIIDVGAFFNAITPDFYATDIAYYGDGDFRLSDLFILDAFESEIPSTIGGYVYDKELGLLGALENVKVTLTNRQSGIIYNATTDSGGYYSIQCPKGDYRIVFELSGYITQSYDITIDGRINGGEALELEPGATKPTGIKGRVIDEITGEPFLSGDFIVKLTKIVSEEVYNINPDSNGSFTIECPSGTYKYEICSNAGYVYYTSGLITVKENQVYDLGTIYVTEPDEPTGIESMVLGEEYNEMLMGVTVTLTNTSTNKVYTGVTDIEGIYKIECPAGIYNIRFAKDGYVPQEKYNITVRKDNIEQIENTWLEKDIGIDRTGIESMVLGEEYNEMLMGVTVTVTLTNTSTNQVYTGVTDIEGIYKIECPAGTYNIKYEKDGYITQEKYNVIVRKDNIEQIENTWLVKDTGTSTGTVTSEMQTIRVKVYDYETKLPIEGVTVRVSEPLSALNDLSYTTFGFTTDSNGVAENSFKSDKEIFPEKAKYRIRASKSGYIAIYTDYDASNSRTVAMQDYINIVKNGNVTEFTLYLRKEN